MARKLYKTGLVSSLVGTSMKCVCLEAHSQTTYYFIFFHLQSTYNIILLSGAQRRLANNFQKLILD